MDLLLQREVDPDSCCPRRLQVTGTDTWCLLSPCYVVGARNRHDAYWFMSRIPGNCFLSVLDGIIIHVESGKWRFRLPWTVQGKRRKSGLDLFDSKNQYLRCQFGSFTQLWVLQDLCWLTHWWAYIIILWCLFRHVLPSWDFCLYVFYVV